MIAAYLIVFGVLAMMVSYVAMWNYILTRVERRDLAALAQEEKKHVARETKTTAAPEVGALPACA